MSSRSLARGNAALSELPRPAARGASLSARLASLPGSDALLLFAAASLALSVFEVAAWLATAPLATLVYSLALVPLVLFVTAVFSPRER